MTRSLALVLLALLLPALAQAGTYRAGPFAYGTGSSIRCAVVNVSTKPVNVEVLMYNGDRQVIGSVVPMALEPADAAHVAVGGLPTVVNYCEFLIGGSRKKVRMLACTQNTNGDCIAVYPVD